MTLQDQYAESSNPALQGRVQMATASAAQDISNEAADTPNHYNRVQLAQQVARSPQNFTPAFTNLLCAEDITSQSTDAEIESMVSAVWNTMAGPPPPTG
jgi:hypothetical protein